MSSNLAMALPNSDVDYVTINLNRKRTRGISQGFEGLN